MKLSTSIKRKRNALSPQPPSTHKPAAPPQTPWPFTVVTPPHRTDGENSLRARPAKVVQVRRVTLNETRREPTSAVQEGRRIVVVVRARPEVVGVQTKGAPEAKPTVPAHLSGGPQPVDGTRCLIGDVHGASRVGVAISTSTENANGDGGRKKATSTVSPRTDVSHWTLPEVLHFVSCAKPTLYRWMKRKENPFPPLVKAGGRSLWEVEKVHEFMRNLKPG